MLFESSGRLWRSSGIMTNSSLMLFSHDLGQASNVLFINADKELIMDASTQEPWASASVAQ